MDIYHFAAFDFKTSILDDYYIANLDPALIQAIKDDPDLIQDSLVRFAKIHNFELYDKMRKAKEALDSYMQEKKQEKKQEEQSLKVEKILAILKELPIDTQDDLTGFTRFNLMKFARDGIKYTIFSFLNDSNSFYFFKLSDDAKNCLQEVWNYLNSITNAIYIFNSQTTDYYISRDEQDKYISEYLKNLFDRKPKDFIELIDNLIFALIACNSNNADIICIRNDLIDDLIIKNKQFCNSFLMILRNLLKIFNPVFCIILTSSSQQIYHV